MGLSEGDQFPVAALSAFGVKGKPACIFFFGADDAPSCSKELSAFDESLEEFAALGVSVVGVRNEAGVKLVYDDLRLVVDEGDEIRNAIGIAKDFGFLGGRETYLVDKSGTVVNVHNNQFDPRSHVTTALEAAELNLPPPSKGFSFELPSLELPSFFQPPPPPPPPIVEPPPPPPGLFDTLRQKIAPDTPAPEPEPEPEPEPSAGFQLPSFELPKVELPTLELPSFGQPSAPADAPPERQYRGYEADEMYVDEADERAPPSFELPALELPKWAQSAKERASANFQPPSFELPKELPKLEVPSFELPKELPKLEVPSLFGKPSSPDSLGSTLDEADEVAPPPVPPPFVVPPPVAPPPVAPPPVAPPPVVVEAAEVEEMSMVVAAAEEAAAVEAAAVEQLPPSATDDGYEPPSIFDAPDEEDEAALAEAAAAAAEAAAAEAAAAAAEAAEAEAAAGDVEYGEEDIEMDLAQMKSFGYEDEAANLAALEAAKGDIVLAMEIVAKAKASMEEQME